MQKILATVMMSNKKASAAALAIAAALGIAACASQGSLQSDMSFFITSVGGGKGADLFWRRKITEHQLGICVFTDLQNFGFGFFTALPVPVNEDNGRAHLGQLECCRKSDSRAASRDQANFSG